MRRLLSHDRYLRGPIPLPFLSDTVLFRSDLARFSVGGVIHLPFLEDLFFSGASSEVNCRFLILLVFFFLHANLADFFILLLITCRPPGCLGTRESASPLLFLIFFAKHLFFLCFSFKG